MIITIHVSEVSERLLHCKAVLSGEAEANSVPGYLTFGYRKISHSGQVTQ